MKHRNFFNTFQSLSAFPSIDRFLRVLLVGMSVGGLTACAHLNNQFDCPHTATGVCASMNEVYQRAQTGDLPSLQPRPSTRVSASAATTSFAGSTRAEAVPVPAAPRVGIVSPALRPATVTTLPAVSSASPSALRRPLAKSADSLPSREPERVLRVWVAPFEDTQGNYHQGTHILAVVAPGTWSTHPVKAVSEQDRPALETQRSIGSQGKGH